MPCICNCEIRVAEETAPCQICYGNGEYFAVNLDNSIGYDIKTLIDREKNELCVYGNSKIYKLCKLISETLTPKHAGFLWMIELDSSLEPNNKKILARSCDFSFNGIDYFFNNPCCISASSCQCQSQIKIKINEQFSLTTQIEKGRILSYRITSSTECPLESFIKVISIISEFFSFCYRRRLYITDVISRDNNINRDLVIRFVQSYTQEFEEMYIPDNMCVIQNEWIEGDFAGVLKQFIESIGGLDTSDANRFRIFCDFYIDVHTFGYNQTPFASFYPYAAGLEAYLSAREVNKDVTTPVKIKELIRFIHKNVSIEHIDKVDFKSWVNLKEKIANILEQDPKFTDLQDILEFYRTNENKKYPDFHTDIVNLRNYFAHHPSAQKIPPTENWVMLTKYTEIFCEIIFMKEVGLSNQQIKEALKNNRNFMCLPPQKYFGLKQ